MTDSSKQIKMGAVLSYGMVLFNIICGLLYTPWMIRQIGKADYGLYILVTSFLHYFVVDFGLWMAVNKILSRLRAEGREDEEKNVIGLTTKIYLCMDIVVCIVVIMAFFFIDRLFGNLTLDELSRFKMAYLIAASFSVLSFPFGFLKGIFQAHEYFIQTKLFDFATKIGITLFTVLLLILNVGFYSLVIVYGAVPFILNVSRVIFLKKKGVTLNIHNNNKSMLKDIFSTSIWLFLIVLAELFINNISPSLLAAFSDTTQIAIFGIGLTLNQYVYTFAYSINGLLLPRITNMSVKNDAEAIHALTYKISRLQLIVTGCITFGIILVGQSFIETWVGPDFSASYIVATALIIPQLLIHMQQVENTQLFVNDKIRYRAFSMMATGVFTIVSSVLLIPKLGAVGSAIAIAGSNFIIMFIVMNIVYHKHLGFSIRQYLKELVPLFIAYCGIVVFYILVCNTLLPSDLNGWAEVFVRGGIYMIGFIISMLIFTNSYEKKLFLSPFRKIIKR